MTSTARAIAAALTLSALSGCAATGASLDRFADKAEARSNCHTSTGELVPAPSCTVSYTVSSSTTTTTTTTTTGAAPPSDD